MHMLSETGCVVRSPHSLPIPRENHRKSYGLQTAVEITEEWTEQKMVEGWMLEDKTEWIEI